MRVRDAVLSDFEGITAIYNDLVRHSTAVYNDQPATVAERVGWWSARAADRFPVLVAVEDDGTIAGYGTFAQFRSWPGYRYTVEVTVHVREGRRRSGVGSSLLGDLIDRAKRLGMHAMVGAIDSGNAESLAFFGRHGFVERGRLPEVGYKNGRFLDLVLMECGIARAGWKTSSGT
jgi:L-amino acid N-acyltransferase YncA